MPPFATTLFERAAKRAKAEQVAPVPVALSLPAAPLHSDPDALSTTAEPAGDPVFRSASSRQEMDIELFAVRHPGALFESACQAMLRFLSSRGEASQIEGSGEGRFVNYLVTVFAARHPQIAVGVEQMREMRTLAEAMDSLAQGDIPRACDLLVQRFKSLELKASTGSSELGRCHELIPPEDVGLISEAERAAGLRRQLGRLKLAEAVAKARDTK